MPRSSTEAGAALPAVLRIPGLAAQPYLVHGLSTLALGDMRAPGPGYPALTAPRRAFAEALGLEPGRLVVAGAVHGVEVARMDEAVGVLRGVDALVTDRPGLALLATFADCYPVVIYDPARHVVALVHAGWRGIRGGVVGRAVHALRREYGSHPVDLIAGLGPGICAGCYEVGEDVGGQFEPAHAKRNGDGRFRLDLAAVIVDHLLAAGVPRGSVHVIGACTRERPELPSHRRAPDGVRFACIAAIR
ncbi:MAG TPA: polyphenol oxidase family protein [Candidatus Dormibacteraeota bacterium]|nr:polyphenol oxidase family protein [Candidatus Dormibacteraeota bacterium]